MTTISQNIDFIHSLSQSLKFDSIFTFPEYKTIMICQKYKPILMNVTKKENLYFAKWWPIRILHIRNLCFSESLDPKLQGNTNFVEFNRRQAKIHSPTLKYLMNIVHNITQFVKKWKCPPILVKRKMKKLRFALDGGHKCV